MKQKEPGRIKQTLIFLLWGLLSMILIFILMLAAGYLGWGV